MANYREVIKLSRALLINDCNCSSTYDNFLFPGKVYHQIVFVKSFKMSPNARYYVFWKIQHNYLKGGHN